MEFKGHSNLAELSALLKDESPRCVVIVAVAFFDETLKQLLNDATEKSFCGRINDARDWGLLTQHEHDDLHTLRKLRNKLAHNLRQVTFDADATTRIAALKLWSTASNALPLAREIKTPLHQLLYVVGVIGFRLQDRAPISKTGPLNEPPIEDVDAWPPVINF